MSVKGVLRGMKHCKTEKSQMEWEEEGVVLHVYDRKYRRVVESALACGVTDMKHVLVSAPGRLWEQTFETFFQETETQ